MTPVRLNILVAEPSLKTASAKRDRLQGMSRALALLLALLAMLSSPLSGQTTLTPSTPRYLFLIDSSSSMSRMAGSTRQLVFDLIFTGAQGRMEPGSIYDLWLFNDRAITNQFRLMNWDPMLNRALANNASEFLKGMRYEKSVRWDRLWPSLQPLLAKNRPLTLFLVSDGYEEMEGTPFDESLNEIYRAQRREARREKIPIVTILEARQGRLAAFAVSRPGSAIPFESLDAQLARAFPETAVAPSLAGSTSDSRTPAPAETASVPSTPDPIQPPSPDPLMPEPAEPEPVHPGVPPADPPKPQLIAIEPVKTEPIAAETNLANPVISHDVKLAASEHPLTQEITNNPPLVSIQPAPEPLAQAPASDPPATPVLQQASLTPSPSAPVASEKPAPAPQIMVPKSESVKAAVKSPPVAIQDSPPPETDLTDIEASRIRYGAASTNPLAASPAATTTKPETELPHSAETSLSPEQLPKPAFNLPPPASVTAAAKAPTSSAWLYFIPGTLLLIMALMIVWMMKHRSKPKGSSSFISRSIERELR